MNTPVSVDISTKSLLKILSILVLVMIAWTLKHIILVVLASVVVASFIEPAVRGLQKIRISRYVSVPFLFLVIIGIVVGMVALLVPVFAAELNDLIALLPKGSDLARGVTSINRFGFSELALQKFTGSSNPGIILQNVWEFLTSSGVGSAFQVFFDASLLFILSFYLAIQEKGVDQFLRVVTPQKYEEDVISIWQRTEKKIGDWFGGQVIAALIVGVLTYFGLMILSVPYALVLAVSVAVFDLLPFGTLLGTIPGMLIGFLSGGYALAFWVVVVYMIIHYIEVYMIQPLIIRKTVGIPIVVMLISVVSWAMLAGVLGVLLSIPCAVLVMELIDQKKTHIGIV